jgi:hypothetical protein
MPLPTGFRIELDQDTRSLTGDLVFGGSPARVLRLTAAGQAAWRELAEGSVSTVAAGTLARRLTDLARLWPLRHPVRGPTPRRAGGTRRTAALGSPRSRGITAAEAAADRVGEGQRDLDPVGYTAAAVADDIAYGAGV